MANGLYLEENVKIGICIYDTYVYLYTFTYLISDYFEFFFPLSNISGKFLRSRELKIS